MNAPHNKIKIFDKKDNLLEDCSLSLRLSQNMCASKFFNSNFWVSTYSHGLTILYSYDERGT